MLKSSLDHQLKEACQLTGSDWAAWVERADAWVVRASYHLDSRKREVLLRYLRLSPISRWVDGALAGNRSRSKRLAQGSGLVSENLYIFPDQVTQRVIMVGASGQTNSTQRLWRVVALGDYSRTFLDPAPRAGVPGGSTGIPYHLPEALNQALKIVLQSISSPSGWLAVRSGDFLEVKACTNNLESHEKRISIEANPLLREIVRSRKARLVERTEMDWAMVPRLDFRSDAQCWVGQPLVMGRRIIGLIGFWLDTACSHQDWERMSQLAADIAPSVEGSIFFSDLSGHLLRMALLNDFAVTISSAVDVGQIVQRMFALLRRAFETDRIILVVRSLDGREIQQYFMQENSINNLVVTAADSPYFRQAEQGEIIRSDSVSSVNRECKYFYPDSHSTLMIPLKYHQQVVGSIGLESLKEEGFTLYDEHLLAVIASHLAGLLENSRLRQDAESRVRNLSLIHDVVEQMIGLTDVHQIAQISAGLMAKNFAYELVCVALFTPDGSLSLAGIGGSVANRLKEIILDQEGSNHQGIVGRVAITGQSLIVNDVSQDPFHFPLPNWDVGSEMCVALKYGERILGVLDVESQKTNAFTMNDLLLLESLAGILAGVVSSAGQYEKLQATVDQLQTARMELQERIVAQKMAESRLVQAAKLAAVGEMAAGIAHELNNPLTTVSGFTELVLDDIPENQPARADLELVLREAQRARGVVRRLLDFSRQTDSVRTRSDISEIVGDVLALTNHLLRTGGIQVHVELNQDLPWIPIDRNQIKQVILNLVHNAMHAMPAGGHLHISTALNHHDSREWVVISIRDSGIGISPENVDRVFEPFFTTRSSEGGTGLGLSVSYGIVVDHGGTIETKSEVGEGSEFLVWLPTEANR